MKGQGEFEALVEKVEQKTVLHDLFDWCVVRLQVELGTLWCGGEIQDLVGNLAVKGGLVIAAFEEEY